MSFPFPMPRYYHLNDKKEVIIFDNMEEYSKAMLELGEQKFHEQNRVKETEVGRYRVSTVLLMIDHNWLGKGDPIIFETVIFPECDYMTRCETYEGALDMHEMAIRMIKSGKYPFEEDE
jgi:hypothetical protein